MKAKVKVREKRQAKDQTFDKVDPKDRRSLVACTRQRQLGIEKIFVISPEGCVTEDSVKAMDEEGRVVSLFTYFSLAFDLGLSEREVSVRVTIEKDRLEFERV